MSGPIHVGVDALNLLHDRRGIWRYARALLQRWIRTPGDRVRITLLVPHAWPRLVRRRLAQILECDDVSVRGRKDSAGLNLHLVWYPWNGMTWISPVVNVATVHDVWPFASPAEDLRRRRSEQTPFRTTAAHAEAIITDSQFSKREIVKHLSVSAQHLHVVHLGVDSRSGTTNRPLLLDGASRYVFFVGEGEPRKDLATLQAAMQRLPDPLRMTTGLVVAGRPRDGAPKVGGVDSTRRDGKNATLLHFEPVHDVPTVIAGSISDSLLQQLYANAGAFAFPSRYEGFGLPVLEAMAQGAPVVAAHAASIPEVAGDAALYFPPGDADALGQVLARVLSDRVLVARLSAAGMSRAATFTWDRCADETLNVFEMVAAGERIDARR